jgi:hypothetical protein
VLGGPEILCIAHTQDSAMGKFTHVKLAGYLLPIATEGGSQSVFSQDTITFHIGHLCS